MRAPDIASLFDFETAIESGLKTILEANLTVDGIGIRRQRDLENLNTPRIEAKLRVGAANGYLKAYNGSAYRAAHNAVLELRVVTARNRNNAPDTTTHASLRSQLRAFLQIASGLFDRDAFPFHTLVSIVAAGTTTNTEEKEDTDISTLSFGVMVGIRTDAWPLIVTPGEFLLDLIQLQYRFRDATGFELWNIDQGLFFAVGVSGAPGVETITVAEVGNPPDHLTLNYVPKSSEFYRFTETAFELWNWEQQAYFPIGVVGAGGFETLTVLPADDGPSSPPDEFAAPSLAGSYRFTSDGRFQLWNPDQSLFFTLTIRGADGQPTLSLSSQGEA